MPSKCKSTKINALTLRFVNFVRLDESEIKIEETVKTTQGEPVMIEETTQTTLLPENCPETQVG